VPKLLGESNESQPSVDSSYSRVNEAPLHRLQVQAVNVARELVDHLLEAAKNVHLAADDARAMPVTSSRQISTHLRRLPLKRPRVKAEENIAHLVNVAKVLIGQVQARQLHNSPSHRSDRRKCTPYFRMQQPCALQPAQFSIFRRWFLAKRKKVEIVKAKLKVFLVLVRGGLRKNRLMREHMWIVE
jgi:hypothetical protein